MDYESKFIDTLILYHSHIDKCQYILLSMVTLQRQIKETSNAELALQLKALGDETRLNLMLKISAASGTMGACICDLTPETKLAQSTVSHHMKLLVDAGLLTRSQQGKWAYFALTSSAVQLLEALELQPGTCSESCCTNS